MNLSTLNQGTYNISKLIEVSNGLIKTVDALKDLVKKAVDDSNNQIKLLYSSTNQSAKLVFSISLGFLNEEVSITLLSKSEPPEERFVKILKNLRQENKLLKERLDNHTGSLNKYSMWHSQLLAHEHLAITGSNVTKIHGNPCIHAQLTHKVAYSSGVHCWALRVGSIASSYLSVGITPDPNLHGMAGLGSNVGISFYCNNFGVYIGGKDPRNYNSHAVKAGDILTTVLNMNTKTVEFFVGNSRKGIKESIPDTPYHYTLSLHTSADNIELLYHH